MNQPQAGYREIEHTADWQLEVWAPNLPLLFEQAALGMYVLSGTQLQSQPRVSEELKLTAPDNEGLLVEFLSELLFLSESQGLAFDCIKLQIESQKLYAKISGAPIKLQSKEIKAVTFHNLEIKEGPRGLEVSIVFDV